MESQDQSNSRITPDLDIDSNKSQPKSKNNEFDFKSWPEQQQQQQHHDHDIQWLHSPTAPSSLATPLNNTNTTSNLVFKGRLSDVQSRLSDIPDKYLIGHRLSTNSNSTTRSSIASSVLSRTLSTTSTALSRYSSVRSSGGYDPVFTSPISPWSPCPGKDDFESPPSYYCTLCSASFDSIDEWKSHEVECHDRRAQYICTECHAVYDQISLLAVHRQDVHNLRTTPAEIGLNTVRDPVKRSAWGCGFCATYLSSQPEYLDHVGGHYDEGRSMSEWRHSFVIRGLLHQPGVKDAWRALAAKMERVAGKEDTFFWDSRITGRSPPSANDVSTPRLQDLLERFSEGQFHPQTIAKAAYVLACNAAPDHTDDPVHDLCMQINVNSMPPMDITTDPASTQSEDRCVFQNMPPGINHVKKCSSMRETASNGSSCDRSAPGRVSYTLPLPVSVREEGQATTSKIFVKVEGNPMELRLPSGSGTSDIRHMPPTLPIQSQPKRGGLRRIDSERNLTVSNPPKTAETANEEQPSYSERLGISPLSSQSYLTPCRTPRLPALLESTSESRMDRLAVAELNEVSSLRSHSNSSPISARTVEDYANHDDSASECDSVSEPDLWLEFDAKSTASKEWSRTYQRQINKVMENLWSQYNQDWDAMIQGCAGGSSHHAPRERESQPARRTQASGSSSSRHISGRSLRPSNRYPIDGDDEEDEESRYPPNASPPKSDSTSPKRFACPFRKHDPRTFNLQDHQICVANTWPSIPRLKEHLYRRHYKIHCQRCKRTFADARGLDTHKMAFEGCAVRNIPPPGDITTAQEKELKSRKKNTRTRLREEEKWIEIYQLLFPHDDVVPSPYPEYTEDLGPISPESSYSLNFQHYLLTQMPVLFHQAAEEYMGRHIQAQEALVMESVPSILQGALQKAFDQWEAICGPGVFPNSIQSPVSLDSFVINPTSVVSPSSPHPPPWSNGHIAHMNTNLYASVASDHEISWAGMTQGLEPMTLTSGEFPWISPPASTGFEPYPFFSPNSGVSDPSFGSFIPPTNGNHDGSYMDHDTQIAGEAHGGPGCY